MRHVETGFTMLSKKWKRAYPEAESLMFVQISPLRDMGIAMWPFKEIRKKEGLAQRAALIESFGASVKEHMPYEGKDL